MCCCTVNDRHLSFSHSVLLSSHGPDGPELFMIDPSGVSWVRNVCPHVLFNENVNYITCSLINFNFFNCSVASLEVSTFYYTCSINIKTKHMTRLTHFFVYFFSTLIFRGSMVVLLGRQSRLQKQKSKNLRSVHHQLFQVLTKKYGFHKLYHEQLQVPVIQ